MNQTQTYQAPRPVEDLPAVRSVSNEEDIQSILSAMEDEFCRQLLDVMSTEFRTAQQFSEACDMPISTTYRKLNTLVDVGLVDTSISLRKSGHHTKEFALGFRSITMELDHPEGTVLLIEDHSGDR